MFGDEPYGNYNRILLSGVLAGTHEPEDIFINPLEWYARQRRDAARRRARHGRSTATRRLVRGDDGVLEPYDVLVFATGSSAVRAAARRGCSGHGTDAEGRRCSSSARSTTATA